MTTPIDIKDLARMLAENIRRLCDQLCPGGRIEGHDYVVRNPIRADRRPGSFRICVTGAKLGVWKDFATGDAGDALDLIAYLGQIDKKDAVAWAKAWLGLDDATPQQLQRRRAEASASQQAHEQRLEEDRARRARQAKAIFLSAEETIIGTPAGAYLAQRGIDPAWLPRPLRSLRYHPRLWCEEVRRELPALVAAIVGLDGSFLAVHRTYLQVRPDGRITKAEIRNAKMTLGTYRGGCIRLWKGAARKALKGLPSGSSVILAEGIEDGLTCALAQPETMVLAAVSLANLKHLELPEAAATVILAQQNDPADSKAAQAFDRACQAFLAQGRRVMLFAPPPGVKDVNDLLAQATKDEGAA